MSAEHHEESTVVVQPVDKAKIRLFMKVTLILFVITMIEFAIAFTVDAGILRTAVFIALTIVKAFYIVSEFMHLGHEVKTLIWSILIPLIFLVWLIIALIYQGGQVLLVR
jgi:cytochrome c oxidase subunit IV